MKIPTQEENITSVLAYIKANQLLSKSRVTVDKNGLRVCKCAQCDGSIEVDYCRDVNDVLTCPHCSATALIIHETLDSITLIEGFARTDAWVETKEAKCCGTCGMFKFQQLRSGGCRVTGFCTIAARSVSQYSVCERWLPRNSERFNSDKSAQLAALTTFINGLKRNGDPRFNRYTYYKECEHKLAQDAKKEYETAYNKFITELINF